MSEIAKQCPWCERWCLKDDQCNYVVCGRGADNKFVPYAGCGHAWCFQCGKKLCGRMFAEDGTLLDPNEDHNTGHRPTPDDPCSGPEYCPGGHNSHKLAKGTLQGPPLPTARPGPVGGPVLRQTIRRGGPVLRQTIRRGGPVLRQTIRRGGPVLWNPYHRGR